MTRSVGILTIGDPDVDDVVGEVLAAVGERVDRAVGKDVDRPLRVTQNDGPEVDRLDQPAGAVDRRDVADAHLILENQEEAADDVAHQRLRAEADRQAGNPGAGQHRRDVDAELVEDHQHGDTVIASRRDVADERPERPRAFGALERVEARALADLVLESSHEQARGADKRVGKERDHQNLRPWPNAHCAIDLSGTPCAAAHRRARMPEREAMAVRTNVARLTSRSGPRTSGLDGEVIPDDGEERAARARPTMNAASQASERWNATTARRTSAALTVPSKRDGVMRCRISDARRGKSRGASTVTAAS